MFLAKHKKLLALNPTLQCVWYSLTSRYQRRMLMLLDAADYDAWLTGSPDEGAGLLRPFAAERMHLALVGLANQSEVTAAHSA